MSAIAYIYAIANPLSALTVELVQASFGQLFFKLVASSRFVLK